jgi:hypothetical protein
MRRIFGLKRNEMAGGWRKLHEEDLHNFYSTPDIVRMIVSDDEMGRPCSTHKGKREFRCGFGGKRPPRRPGHGWEDYIKIKLREVGWGGMDKIHLAQDREHGNEPSGSIKCWEILEQVVS